MIWLAGLLATSDLTAKPAQVAPEAVWRSACGYCHSGSKVGPPIPAHIPPVVVKFFVRNGAGAMPPFHRSEIDDGELDALAHWLQAGGQASATRR